MVTAPIVTRLGFWHPGLVVEMFNHNRLYEPLKKSPLFIEFPYIRASILESAEC